MTSGHEIGRPLLVAEALSKSFGSTLALDGVSLEIASGEVHALLGQNGSGKSTLIKILAGYIAPDGGSVAIRGDEMTLPLTAADLARLGISFVHQDLGLVETMSVLDNLRLRRYDTGVLRNIRWRSERLRARELLARFEVSVDPDVPVSRLSHATKAVIAVLRALQDFEGLQGRGLLVLDEPTAYLPQHEIDILFALVRRIRDAGASILFVTHRVQEVLALADRVTVLRDGKRIETRPTAGLDERQLIRLIVGRDVEEFVAGHRGSAEEELALTVSGLTGAGVRDVSLAVRKGEIVGLTGLIGAGHEVVPYLLFGATPARSLTLEVAGTKIPRPTPHRMKGHGLGFLPADRQRLAALPRATIRSNVTLPTLKRYHGRLRLIRRAREHRDVGSLLQRLKVHPPDPGRLLFTLSGGNQQKALLGRWLHASPHVLLLHEPTQGVDVGSRETIFSILRSAAAAGMGILCSSTQHEDLAQICDRVLIFHEGRIVKELSGMAIDANVIAYACYHVEPAAQSA